MLPMLMRLKITDKKKTSIRLWFPVILIWVIVFALLIVSFPFAVLLAFLTLRKGPGIDLIGLYPLPIVLLFSLSGLLIQLETEDNVFHLSFH